jgi:hypothetical protein
MQMHEASFLSGKSAVMINLPQKRLKDFSNRPLIYDRGA